MRKRRATEVGALADFGASAPRLTREDFATTARSLARKLIGCTLVRITDDGTRLSGIIVETEAYTGVRDRASHSYNGHRSPRNEPMYGPPGMSYVYFTYGMHHCVNVGAAALGVPEAVLIRALEPVDGIDIMRATRARASKSPRLIPDHDLCRGPAKLCSAMALDRAHSGLDLTTSPILWIEPRRARKLPRIITAPRIGIDRVPEPWRSAPFRYLTAGNPCVSRPPKAKNR